MERLKLKHSKNKLLVLNLFLLPFVFSNEVLAGDFKDQASIVNAHMMASYDDKNLAESIAQQARDKSLSMKGSSKNNIGILFKLWCESALIAPKPENLAECAKYKVKVVSTMSNPQPSKEAVYLKRVNESLVMIRAALEIAGGDSEIDAEFRSRLKRDFICLNASVSEKDAGMNCYK